MKFFQGHIICDSCHARAEEEANAQWGSEGLREGNPNIDLCHTCREVITGRPSELERVLGLTEQTTGNIPRIFAPSFRVTYR